MNNSENFDRGLVIEMTEYVQLLTKFPVAMKHTREYWKHLPDNEGVWISPENVSKFKELVLSSFPRFLAEEN